MKKRYIAALGLGAIAAAAYVTGFPKRIGLTASEAAVSLPGDLLLPNPGVVVDRGIRIEAPADAVWRVLEQSFEGDESRVVAREENSALILRIPAPGLADEDDFSGTCVFALLPLGQGRTLLHMRERHPSREDAPDAALLGVLAAESFSTMRMLSDIRKAAEAPATPCACGI